MGLGDLARAAAAAADQPTPPPVYTATVVRADESGLWVVPIDDDPRHPIGPCRGGWTANGTRVPPGALVILVETAEGPWAVGVDNPALAINDSTLAPFHNPSFELIDDTTNTGAAGWNYFGLFGDVSTRQVITGGGAAYGQRHLHVAKNGSGGAFIQSTPWTVVAGSSLEISYYGRRTDGGAARISPYIFTAAPGMGEPGLLNPNSVTTLAAVHLQSDDWLRYRATVALPPTHTRVAVLLRVDTADGNPLAVDIDNVDADLVILDPSTAHADYVRRATLVLQGGGTRTVTPGGNVSWSQPFVISGAGRGPSEAVDGRFEIAQPPNGTVIPVHGSSARTTHTVAGGVIALNADDALWYELPLGAAATSQPGRFHILGASLADNYAVPPHWILVVTRSAWSSTNHAPEFRWGDGRLHDPWRTPSFSGAWVAGTVAPRFRKEADGDVTMRGRVAGGTFVAFQLPVGYRPPAVVEAIVRDGMGMVGMVTVAASGDVTPVNNNTDHSIAIRFSTEQP